jgi:predicted RNA-binding Zn-ribbon protein involved in translation (DUF1610 family)
MGYPSDKTTGTYDSEFNSQPFTACCRTAVVIDQSYDLSDGGVHCPKCGATVISRPPRAPQHWRLRR